MVLKTSFERSRKQARAVAFAIFVLNFLVLHLAVFHLGSSYHLSELVLENKAARHNITLSFNATDEFGKPVNYVYQAFNVTLIHNYEKDKAQTQLSDLTTNSLIYIASAIPQLIGAWVLFAATEEATPLKKATTMVDCHQKVQLFFLFIGFAGFSISLAKQMAENNSTDAESTLLFIITEFFRAACILIVGRFEKELRNQPIDDNCIPKRNWKFIKNRLPRRLELEEYDVKI